MKTLDTVDFDDLEGMLEVVQDRYDRRVLTVDDLNTMFRSFLDPEPFMAEVTRRGIEANADG